MTAQWYVVYSKPRKEVRIDLYLRSQQMQTFYPVLKVDPVNPRAAHVRAFFPRYLFVHADLDEVGISGLQWIPGAVGLVRLGSEPTAVPDAFIETLRRRIIQIQGAGGLHLDGLKAGDPVNIISGLFAGYEALFALHLSGEQRVQVLMHWLGRSMKVKVNANAVEKRRVR